MGNIESGSLGKGAVSGSARERTRQVVHLLHISDTHNMHGEIETRFPFQDADILLHTGDFTNNGTLAELRRFNKWLGRMKTRFKYVLVIAGNHDVHGNGGSIDLRRVLSNATVLHHEIAAKVQQDLGLRIFGSPWCAWKPASDPGGRGHLFGEIPEGVDVLMTHGPARQILDTAGYGQSGQEVRCYHWGSSWDLNEAIRRARPRAHLFGHLHEQRGVWQRDVSGGYAGGVEYMAERGCCFPTTGAPPDDWPCDLVSCNAMCNHAGHERVSEDRIAGPARRIRVQRDSEREPWRFTAL